MDYVVKIYNEGKLLVRAMDQPTITIDSGNKQYECQSWINEFSSLMNKGLYSLSTTLIISGVGVRTYKNMGFLINSDWAKCHHIAASDSASSGNVADGDFKANKSDFNNVLELATYIKNNKKNRMNEVNVNIKLDGVVGLFINKSNNIDYLLKKIYIIKETIKAITGIEYPIYLYDWTIGKLELIELTKEKENEIIDNLECHQVFCWPDDISEPFYIPVDSKQYRK